MDIKTIDFIGLSDKIQQLKTTADFDNQNLVSWINIVGDGKTYHPFVSVGETFQGVRSLYEELLLKELEEKKVNAEESCKDNIVVL